MIEKVEGIIERIGYDPASSSAFKGNLNLVLVDNDNVYISWGGARIVYADVGAIGDESWLLLLTQAGDHITFELDYGASSGPLLGIKKYSLRNWTLEQRLSGSLKDITPKDKKLSSSHHNVLSDNS